MLILSEKDILSEEALLTKQSDNLDVQALEAHRSVTSELNREEQQLEQLVTTIGR